MALVQDYGKCSTSRSTSYVVLCLECSQHVRRPWSKMKCSGTSWSSDTPTFKLINKARASTIKHSVFSVIAGLNLEILSCFFPFIALCNGLEMSEYEVYCVIDFPLIIVGYAPRNNLKQSKWTSIRKNLIIVIQNKKQQGWSPAPRYSSGNLIPIIHSCQQMY